MNYPDTVPADPSAFSLWPDATAASEEEMAMWAQAAGYAQPGFNFENIPLHILGDTLSATWGQSGTTPAEVSDYQHDSNINWTYGGTVTAGMSSQGVPLPNATAIGTFAPAITPPFFNNNTDAYGQGFFPQIDFSNSSTPSLTNTSSLPSPQSDGFINGFHGFGNPEAAPSSFFQPQGLSFPPNTAGVLDPNRIACAPPAWSMGGSDLAGQIHSGVSPLLDPTYPAPWDFIQPSHLATPTEALTTMATLEAGPSTSLGKRSRQSDEDGSGGPKKKGRPNATRVRGGAESTTRTRRFPATRTQNRISDISKAAGRGAERLVSTTAQGIYHRSLLGLSVPQGSVGPIVQVKPSWIVGREQVETRHDTGSFVPQQIAISSMENAQDEEPLHKIPANLSERERLMLEMTQAEKERGAVRRIKCKLCPKARLSTWVVFQRHCNTCEKHPSSLEFCPTCGDYFGRSDSGRRHGSKKNKGPCDKPKSDDAKQKKEQVERSLKAFEATMMHCLKNGEEFKLIFSHEMTGKLENTSKKVSKRKEIS